MDVVRAMQASAQGEVDVSNAKVWAHFHQMGNAAAVADFCKNGSIFFATVASGDVLFVPNGHVISECIMDDKNVFGLRAPVLYLVAVAVVVVVWRLCDGACGSTSRVRFNRVLGCVDRGVGSCLTSGNWGGWGWCFNHVLSRHGVRDECVMEKCDVVSGRVRVLMSLRCCSKPANRSSRSC